MSFQLKDFASITAAMINRARATQTKITDFNVGSVARTLMESPAIEIEELYQRMFAGILDAIPVAIYRAFNWAVGEAAKATGTITITFNSALTQEFTVPAKAVFVSPSTGFRYLAQASITAEVGATSIAVPVQAENAGSSYNVASDEIVAVSGFSLPSLSALTHPAITSGKDGETEEARMVRFAEYVASFSRGTVRSVIYAAATAKLYDGDGALIEYVSRVGVEETPGTADVFIYGANDTPSAALIAEAQKIIEGYYDNDTGKYVPGYRPIGTDILVRSMEEEARDITATVGLEPGFTLFAVTNAVRAKIVEEIGAVYAGEVLYVENLKTAVLSVAGVRSVRFDLSENYTCPQNVVLTPGSLMVLAEA